MSWLSDIGFFALLFFVLVFVHELGHFLMAKWVGIRVERFAIGMAPKLFSFKRGDTEYMLGALPLGGYVKMAGDDPSKEYTEEEKRVGFLTQKPPAKLLVVFGGPMFNLILPIILFAIMLASGIPSLKPVMGTVDPEMAAAVSSIQSGDEVLRINDRPVSKWGEVESRVDQSKGQPLKFDIRRTNLTTGQAEEISLNVTPRMIPTKSKYGEDIQAPRIGVSPEFVVPELFFNDGSLLAKSGFQRMDRVVKVNAVSLTTMDQLRAALESLKPGAHTFTVLRKSAEVQITVNIPGGKGKVADRLGMLPIELVIGRVDQGTPAEKAGLLANDYLNSINGIRLTKWEDVAKIVRGSNGKAVEVEVNRNGKILKLNMVPEKSVIKDPLMGKDNPLAAEAVYRIGIGPATNFETSFFIERSLNPITCLKRGFTETWNMASMTVTALYKIISGQLSVKLLGSPIMIYKVAGNSYRMAGGGYQGWISFMTNLALLSIALGLMNLLPVPVLDGGHATFFTIEWIRGKPMSLRMMEIASQVGLFLLICLFGLVLFNDFHRYGWIDSLLKVFQ